MTGLDYSKDHIIEIAVVITTGKLEVVAKGPTLVIHQPQQVMQEMNEWCIQHHGATGLTAAVEKSTTTAQQAQDQILAFVKQYISSPKSAPLAGNSVHADRAFLVVNPPNIFSTR